MRKILIFSVVLGMLIANLLLAYRLDEALDRVEASEKSQVDLLVQFDQLAVCFAQCDDVILQRQNDIIQELRRLDYNQRGLIEILAPSVEDELEEAQ